MTWNDDVKQPGDYLDNGPWPSGGVRLLVPWECPVCGHKNEAAFSGDQPAGGSVTCASCRANGELEL